MVNFPEFFRVATHRSPFPYQESLAQEPWPQLLDIPTGLGKTAAVSLAWLWKWYEQAPDATRRLVYCLPMRVLVEQTAQEVNRWLENLRPRFGDRTVPTVHVLMGGVTDNEWDEQPDHPAILIGTQDMLVSRALNRGYGVSRYRWPMQFAQLNNDALWLLDETQLMGVAVETSAQLQGLREKLGTLRPVRTLWMSATLSDQQLGTIDHPVPECGWRRLTLGDADHTLEAVRKRTCSSKSLRTTPFLLDKATAKGSYTKLLADLVLAEHVAGTLTLVVLNRVQRAQDLYAALLKRGRKTESTGLIHARFRPPERRRHESLLTASGDRIIVATQAIEAGVDVSAATLMTELAPWSSLVQRFGRCNRYGEVADARIFWLDVADDLAPPYETEDLAAARTALRPLAEVGPAKLREVAVPQRPIVRPVLRRKDLLDLFDTTPDLSGNDLDVAPYVRDGEDTDVQLFWREIQGQPSPEFAAPARDELCSVSIGAAKGFAQKLWRWDPLEGTWDQVERNGIRPGMVLLVDAKSGGYDEVLGWSPKSKGRVTPLTSEQLPSEQMDSEPGSALGRWVPLSEHLNDVADSARSLASVLGLGSELQEVLATVGHWHDVGKAHQAFQNGIGSLTSQELWAKSPNRSARVHYKMDDGSSRRGFRHELASALAWLQLQSRHPQSDLVAYLIAAHHGKVRLSIRSMPNERKAPTGTLFARGVWDQDVLPAIPGYLNAPVTLRLDVMHIGDGSWLSRTLRLRDEAETGPFRLAFLEALIRAADWRASKLEEERTPAHA